MQINNTPRWTTVIGKLQLNSLKQPDWVRSALLLSVVLHSQKCHNLFHVMLALKQHTY